MIDDAYWEDERAVESSTFRDHSRGLETVSAWQDARSRHEGVETECGVSWYDGSTLEEVLAQVHETYEEAIRKVMQTFIEDEAGLYGSHKGSEDSLDTEIDVAVSKGLDMRPIAKDYFEKRATLPKAGEAITEPRRV